MPNDTASRLDELLDGLASYAGESKEKKREVALKLLDNEATKEIGEVIYKKGLSKRKADDTGSVTEMEARLKEAKDELAEAKSQIAELQAKEPNWNRRLEDEAKKWQARLDAAESKAREERQTGLKDRVQTERQKFIAALRIGQEDGVEEFYGGLLPAQYTGNFVPDEESRTVKVLELGETSSYYDPSEGDPAEQLARDVLAKVPPKYRILGNPEGGGGSQNGQNSGPMKPRSIAQIQEVQRQKVGYATP